MGHHPDPFEVLDASKRPAARTLQLFVRGRSEEVTVEVPVAPLIR